MRVLVVDDSVVIRKLVSDVLAADRDIDVVGTAPNGRIALAKIESLSPDLVTLDVEMPEMDGLETIVEIRKRWPRLPVIMFSTLTERCGRITIDAMARGASDYVTKPAHVGSMLEAQQRIRDELIPKIKGLVLAVSARAAACDAPARTGGSTAQRDAMPCIEPRGDARSATRIERRIDLVAIGSSTGGPNALAALIPHLPADFPAPIVITQHMPPVFTKLLADRLDAASALRVCEAVDGEKMCAGAVYVAPGNCHLTLVRDAQGVRVQLSDAPAENSCRPAVDPMFRSAAAAFGASVLAVVLTGMGRDGSCGADEIRRVGGTVWVQDECSSVVWGMPGHIANAGHADAVLSLACMAESIVSRVMRQRRAA